MKWITLTVSEQNGKLALDWGLRGVSALDLRAIPDVFGLRSYIASKIERPRGILARAADSLRRAARSVFPYRLVRTDAATAAPTTATNAPNAPASGTTATTAPQATAVPEPAASGATAKTFPTVSEKDFQFLDFTKEDLWIAKQTAPVGAFAPASASASAPAAPAHALSSVAA